MELRTHLLAAPEGFCITRVDVQDPPPSATWIFRAYRRTNPLTLLPPEFDLHILYGSPLEFLDPVCAQIELRPFSSRTPWPPFPQGIHVTFEPIRTLREAASATPRTTTVDPVLSYMKGRPGASFTAREISQAINSSIPAVRAALRILLNVGKIRRLDRGQYTVNIP